MDDTDDNKKKRERYYRIIAGVFAVLAAFGLGYLIYRRFFANKPEGPNPFNYNINKPNVKNIITDTSPAPNSIKKYEQKQHIDINIDPVLIKGTRNAESITKQPRPNLRRTMSNTGINYTNLSSIIKNNSQKLGANSTQQSVVKERVKMLETRGKGSTHMGSNPLSKNNINAIKSGKNTAIRGLENDGFKFKS